MGIGLKGLVAELLALAVAWIAPVAAQAQGAEPVTTGPTRAAPMPPVEPHQQAPPLGADRSTNEDDEATDGQTEASAAQTEPGGDEGESDTPPDAEEPVGQASPIPFADRDCPEFSSQEEAQEFFEDQGGPEEDPARLDADDDGEACEDFFEDSLSVVPRGGVDAGVGADDATPQNAAPLFLVGLAGVAVAGLLGTTLFLRRRTR